MANRKRDRTSAIAIAALYACTNAAEASAQPTQATQAVPPPAAAQPPPTIIYTSPAPPAYYGAPPVYGVPAPAPGPRILDWEEGEPIPPGYSPSTRIRKGLVIGGAVTFGTTYLLSAFVAAADADTNSSQRLGALFVPCIGPFIALGTARPNSTGTFALVVDGLAQTGGALMFVLGLVAPRTVLIRNDIAKTWVMPTPMSFGLGSGGLGLVGTL